MDPDGARARGEGRRGGQRALVPLVPVEPQRVRCAPGAAGYSSSCMSLLLSQVRLRTVHARRVPLEAPPLGPPSARGEPPPAHPLVAACAAHRATGNLVGIAVSSCATLWTPLRLAYAACWELWRAARSGCLARRSLWGFFREFVVLVLLLPAMVIVAVLPRCIWMPAALPPRRSRQMGGAPSMMRAKARSAGSGVATSG